MTGGDTSQPTVLTDAEFARLGASMLRDIPDAVVYCDRAGVIRFWNAGAERMFGFAATEAIGQSLDIIIPQRLRQRHWDGYQRMMETGRSQHGPEEILSVPANTRSGQTLSVQFTVAPVGDAAGQVAGIVALLRDVTATFQELKRLRQR